MEFHRGRLFDHIHLRTLDLEASKRFYVAAAAALGVPLSAEGDGWFSIDTGKFTTAPLFADQLAALVGTPA